jgi:hypothetical protein
VTRIVSNDRTRAQMNWAALDGRSAFVAAPASAAILMMVIATIGCTKSSEFSDAGEDIGRTDGAIMLDASMPDASRALSLATFCEESLIIRAKQLNRCAGGELDYYQNWNAQSASEEICLVPETAVREGKAGFDSQRAEECLARLNSASCGEFSFQYLASLGIPGPRFPECSSLVVGLLQEGLPCVSGFECALGLYCDNFQGSACTNTCRRRAHDNDSCVGVPCDIGLFCKSIPGDATRRCYPVSSEYVTCDEFPAKCGIGEFCNNGICQSEQGIGGACVQGQNSLRDGCLGVFQRCQDGACVEARVVGELCTPSLYQCAIFHYCTDAGFCAGPSLLGESCPVDDALIEQFDLGSVDGYSSFTCTGTTFCRPDESEARGVCVARKKIGEECGLDDRCDRSDCIDGACVPRSRSCAN